MQQSECKPSLSLDIQSSIPTSKRILYLCASISFIAWRFFLVLTPSSPILRNLPTDPLESLGVMALFVLPFVLVIPLSDSLEKDGGRVRYTLTLVCVVLSSLLPVSWVQLVLLSFGFCGLQIINQVVTASHGYYTRDLVVGYLVAGAIFVADAFAEEAVRDIAFRILPIISIASFMAMRFLFPCKIAEHRPSAESRKRTSFFVHNPFTTFAKSFVSGIGTACLLIGAATVMEAEATVGIALFLMGGGVALVSFVYQRFSNVTLILLLSVTYVPMLLAIPYAVSSPWAMLLLSLVGIVVGRISIYFNFKEGNAHSAFWGNTSDVEFFFIGLDFSVGLAGSFLGLFCLYCLVQSAPAIWTSIFCDAVLFVSVVYALVYLAKTIRERDEVLFDEQAQLVVPETMSWSMRIEPVAEKYKLSPRQAEILELLARGRNAEFISNEFVISKATVKSHIYAIYKKLHVHSQQELIDLIEKNSRKA